MIPAVSRSRVELAAHSDGELDANDIHSNEGAAG